MNARAIAEKYIHHLERAETEDIINLFSIGGRVNSPLYGDLPAQQFYRSLADDTQNSQLQIKEIFENPRNNSLALYFNFQWTLNNGKHIDFDVVEIIKYDEDYLITSLTIIYDTVITRQYFEQLNQ